MKKLQWYFHRFQAMVHPWEEIYRVRQFFQWWILDFLHGRFFKPQPIEFKNGLLEPDWGLLKEQLPADADLRSYRVFTQEIPDLTILTNWSFDPKNGIENLQQKLPVRFSLQDFEENGEIKYLYELSRMHFLPMWAACAFLHKEDQWVSEIDKLIVKWSEQNPYLQSVHWKNGIEVAIRAVNLVLTRFFLAQMEQEPSELSKRIEKLCHAHLHFLERHLSLYSSANNHLLAELCGIITLQCAYECKPKRSLKFYVDLLNEQIGEQFSKGGWYREHCTHYHLEVLEYLSWIDLVLDSEHEDAKTRIQKTINKGRSMLGDLVDRDGRLPIIGDADGGHLIMPYFDRSYQQNNSLLQDKPDFRNILLNEKHRFGDSANTSESADYDGFVVLRSSGWHLMLDCAEFGLPPLNAHSHAGVLAVLLNVEGVPFLVDSGAYQYHNRYKNWRNYFKGSLAHNTYVHSKIEPAESKGRMLWLKTPEVQCHVSEDFNQVEGSHNGFVNQGIDLVHHRKIVVGEQIQIFDSYKGSVNPNGRLNFHFHPDVELKQQDDAILASNGGLTIRLGNSNIPVAAIYKGSEEPISGWYSRAYDVKEPCSTLSIPVKGEVITPIVTQITRV